MYRVHPFFRNAAGALLILLLAAAFVTVPAPLEAYEPEPFVIGSGGGGGIVPDQEGDPTDSNDYNGGTPDIPDDGGYHEDTGIDGNIVVIPAIEPRVTFFGRWSFRLGFDNVRGVAMPYFSFYRVAVARGE